MKTISFPGCNTTKCGKAQGGEYLLYATLYIIIHTKCQAPFPLFHTNVGQILLWLLLSKITEIARSRGPSWNPRILCLKGFQNFPLLLSWILVVAVMDICLVQTLHVIVVYLPKHL